MKIDACVRFVFDKTSVSPNDSLHTTNENKTKRENTRIKAETIKILQRKSLVKDLKLLYELEKFS